MRGSIVIPWISPWARATSIAATTATTSKRRYGHHETHDRDRTQDASRRPGPCPRGAHARGDRAPPPPPHLRGARLAARERRARGERQAEQTRARPNRARGRQRAVGPAPGDARGGRWPVKNTILVAAIYIRKSNEQLDTHADQKSVERQREHAIKYATEMGWRVDERFIYVDDGITGADFTTREGFLSLMEALKTK